LEIENLLKKLNLQIARNILTGGRGSLEKLKRQNNALLTEKKRLLADSRFGEDYLNPSYRCPVCHDTGFVGNERCACFKQRLIEKYYGLSNLQGVLGTENFGTFNKNCYSSQEDAAYGLSPRDQIEIIYRHCRQFITDFQPGASDENLLFYGRPGLGKTFMCNCIAKELLDRGVTVLYVTAPKLFKMLEDCRFNHDYTAKPEMLDAITDVDLLIIDDLGTEMATIFTSSELFNILNTRIIERKAVVISTNLEPEEFKNQYSERITSRFFGHFKMLRFIGEDIRIVKKYHNISRAS
jgi:DNA replication protein DnaC